MARQFSQMNEATTVTTPISCKAAQAALIRGSSGCGGLRAGMFRPSFPFRLVGEFDDRLRVEGGGDLRVLAGDLAISADDECPPGRRRLADDLDRLELPGLLEQGVRCDRVAA